MKGVRDAGGGGGWLGWEGVAGLEARGDLMRGGERSFWGGRGRGSLALRRAR